MRLNLLIALLLSASVVYGLEVKSSGGGISSAEVAADYVQKAGDTMTGDLTVDADISVGSFTATGQSSIGTPTKTSTLSLLPHANGEGFVIRETDDGNNAVSMIAGAGNGVINILSGGVNKISLSGASDPVYFNTGQNVGIGTAVPAEALDVVGNFSASGFVGIGTAVAGYAKTVIYNNTAGDQALNIDCDQTDKECLAIASSGSGTQTSFYMSNSGTALMGEFDSAVSTGTLYMNGALGGAIMFRDTDDAGCTIVTTLNGTGTFFQDTNCDRIPD